MASKRNLIIFAIASLVIGYVVGIIASSRKLETISIGGMQTCNVDDQCKGSRNFCRQGYCTNLAVDESLSRNQQLTDSRDNSYGGGNATTIATRDNYQMRNNQVFQQCLLSKGLSDAGQRVQCAMDYARYNAIAELVGN